MRSWFGSMGSHFPILRHWVNPFFLPSTHLLDTGCCIQGPSGHGFSNVKDQEVLENYWFWTCWVSHDLPPRKDDKQAVDNASLECKGKINVTHQCINYTVYHLLIKKWPRKQKTHLCLLDITAEPFPHTERTQVHNAIKSKLQGLF